MIPLNEQHEMWLLETAAAAGHPDPEGFTATVARNARKGGGNWGGLTDEEAEAYGVQAPNEPVMSVFGALQAGKTTTVGRDAVLSRYNDGIITGRTPVNPFVNNQGQLILHNVPAFDLDEDTDALADLITETLDDLDGLDP